MSKYCPLINRVVTYQFCQDCDDKPCKNSPNKSNSNKNYHSNKKKE